MSSHNRNPTGNNQYGHIRMLLLLDSDLLYFLSDLLFLAKADDPVLSEALTRYHREGKSSNTLIQRLYEVETGQHIRSVENTFYFSTCLSKLQRLNYQASKKRAWFDWLPLKEAKFYGARDGAGCSQPAGQGSGQRSGRAHYKGSSCV